MTYHHSAAGGHRRQGARMPRDMEWIVPRTPVADADRRAGAEPASPVTRERVAELKRKVRDGAYDNVETMDAVARRILQSGDL
jgi:anti-sigma28 factor (negative regulator of flagellin synthesis)